MSATNPFDDNAPFIQEDTTSMTVTPVGGGDAYTVTGVLIEDYFQGAGERGRAGIDTKQASFICETADLTTPLTGDQYSDGSTDYLAQSNQSDLQGMTEVILYKDIS